MTPDFDYGPTEDSKLRLPVTVSRARNMRKGEFFVISPDNNNVSQVRMLFRLLKTVAHAAAIVCRSLAELHPRHPQAALLDSDGPDLHALLALLHDDIPSRHLPMGSPCRTRSIRARRRQTGPGIYSPGCPSKTRDVGQAASATSSAKRVLSAFMQKQSSSVHLASSSMERRCPASGCPGSLLR